MLDDNGRPFAQLYDSDMIHLNAAGYRLWQLKLAPLLDQWAIKRPPNEC